jgi:hypothetical protein
MWKETILTCSKTTCRSSPRESKEGTTGKFTRIEVIPLPPNYEEAVPLTLERFFLELLLSKYPDQNFTHNFTMIRVFVAKFSYFYNMEGELWDNFAVCLSVNVYTPNFQDCEVTLLPASPCIPQIF